MSLDRSNELVNLANLKLAHVKHDIAVNRRELSVAKRNLARSRTSIAKRLVTLYTAGSTSTLEVILGGHTLARSSTASIPRTGSPPSTLRWQTRCSGSRHRCSAPARALANEQVQVQRLVAQRAAQRRAIEVRLGERHSLLTSLNGEVARLIARSSRPRS